MMKRKEIPEWEHITDYRPFEEKSYEFDFSLGNDRDGTAPFEPTDIRGEKLAALNYAREIVIDPCNSKWLERRKLTDAFQMGVEYAKRYLNGG
jgi:hypothetical protein